MVSPLNSSDPIVTDLSENGTRPFSGVELNGQMTDMFLNVPVRDWGQTILDMDKPNYWRTFAGIITTFFSLTLDDDTADTIIDALADLFNFPEVEYIFLTEKFLPAVSFLWKQQTKGKGENAKKKYCFSFIQIRPLMADIELTSLETMQLDANFDSALIKLLYSFLWQEWAIVDSDIWLQPEVNEKGTQLMPVVNAFANVLNNWPEYDQDLQVFFFNWYSHTAKIIFGFWSWISEHKQHLPRRLRLLQQLFSPRQVASGGCPWIAGLDISI